MVDVAKRAGVGMATVSRALNGAPGVAASTRDRVLAVAREIGYVVSPEASRLARGSTGRVAVVIPHASRWFFAAMLEFIIAALRHADFDVLIYQVPTARARHEFFERLPARRKVDAVLAVGLPVDEHERDRLSLMGVQVVAAGGQTADFPFVRIDDVQAARQATSHLAALGHTRIGMIEAVDPESPEWHVELKRSQGYYIALAEAGIEPNQDLVVRERWGGEGGADAMARLISLPQPPTAVYAHSDEVALGAIRTLRRAGMDVPGDMSIIGIDDHPLAALCDLTTIGQPIRQQAERAVRMTLDLLSGQETDTSVTLPTILVPRRSTARIRRAAPSATS